MRFILAITILLFSVFNAQTYMFKYRLVSKEYPSNKELKDIAYVLTKKNTNEKLYKVAFGKQEKETKSESYYGSLALPRTPYEYILYTKNGRQFFIQDFIQEKYYSLEDSVAFKWDISSETKTIDGIELNKATTQFRGRTYTAWFKPSNEWQVAPWKFSGLSGIVYEVYDDKYLFQWMLIQKEKTQEELKNPFEKTQQFIPYQKYPKLRYGLSEELEKALSQNPDRTIFEQPRVDLEIKFKWEQ
ncbi:GLPGLI family protein [Riemerella columbina]|uniref:GLPGLI family protein n=1 Tax=Riemerella columbina TaxID=103810 RepID=UPI0003691038|nr:GLPGLI family protein [Riemerella columbina]